MKNCPECERTLANSATLCECGWTKAAKAEPERERVPCAHETCDFEAKVRVKTPTGWASVCLPHYERFHEDIAIASCEAKGLSRRADETIPEWRKRMTVYLKANARLKTFDDAEAFEDDQGAQELEDEWSRTA